MSESAPKLDGEKTRMDLIAPDFLRSVADVMTFGARKYEAWSWTKGKAWSRDYAAALRHLSAWHGGEDLDPESGLPHLAHASADLMFLLVSQLRGLGTDDRLRITRDVRRPYEMHPDLKPGQNFGPVDASASPGGREL